MANSQTITLEQVHHVAALARLTLGDEEAKSLVQDLGKILEYVHKLDELDTADVPATAHAIALPTHFRNDEAVGGLSVNKALAGAPEPIADGFGVPKIIE